ncbi:hypothetical protein CI610_01817 [invertebrate metagenome]|uniref:CheW-like domain-containing protein n=1 Tax=invertebrate metagenome TaxID=1711999 RepID=A0A2H9T7M3_9ZZZZ
MTSSTVLLKQPNKLLTDQPELPLEDRWNSIGFNIHGIHCVTPIEEVSNILSIPDVTPLPCVQPWIKGICGVKGHLLPVIDLGVFITGQTLAPSSHNRLLTIEEGKLRAGLLVKGVSSVKQFPAHALQTANMPNMPEQLAPFITGYFRQASNNKENAASPQHYLVFSINRLMTDTRFLNGVKD